MRIVRSCNLPESFYSCRAADDDRIRKRVKNILDEVMHGGDRAVIKFTRKFDRVSLKNIRVKPAEINRAYKSADPGFMRAIKAAATNIKKFARSQAAQIRPFRLQVTPGVIAEQKIIPVQRVGIYVPAGRYPLVSTLLMCAVPAKCAGVSEIALCSPPDRSAQVNPLILAAAAMLGITEIYKIGGAQAIAALAYGTGSVKKVDKIVGPGNCYVTQAKKEVYGTVGIDLIAGPSEIMIIADKFAEPAIIAADLLAQSEHDAEASAVLVTDSQGLAIEVKKEIKRQLASMKTRKTAARSITKNGLIILVKNIHEAVEIANRKAPEHLELQVKDPSAWVKKIRNYGSLFVGGYAAEVLGDYSSGLNHTLPTSGAARYTGGLSVRDFLKFQTVLKVTKKGLARIGPVAEKLAQAEGLDGHARAVKIRYV